VYAPGVSDGGRPLSESRERARKIRPQYAQGPLVRVATARNQAEAEMLEGLLLEEGIPSLVRRTGGFDVPDFLASGPRELLVPAAGAEPAREILGTPEPTPQRAVAEGTPAWVKALAVALAVGIVAIIAAGVFAAVFP
jgi:Putative prokaryotic signal transducing protein